MKTTTTKETVATTSKPLRKSQIFETRKGSQASPKLIEGLNTLLANEYALFTKTLNYHWNVTGPRFHSIHEFLEEHYRTLLEKIDDVAERIREVGSQPCGTMMEFRSKSQVQEHPGVFPEASVMIGELLKDHNLVCGSIRQMLSDETDYSVDHGTEDFLTGLLKEHEEMAWMLKSHLS